MSHSWSLARDLIRNMLVCLSSAPCVMSQSPIDYPHPRHNPSSPVMLAGDWVPSDPHQIDFARLPQVPAAHVVLSDVRASSSVGATIDKRRGGVNQHNYLEYYAGAFWAMWSDGPGVEDRVGQRVSCATSRDGLQWSAPKHITPFPPGSTPDSPYYGTRDARGFRYIARGFWQREGQLLALVALDEAADFFGPSLELRAFRYLPNEDQWEDAGLVSANTINNFPPRQLPGGAWMMSRRTFDYKTRGVEFSVGGVTGLNHWQTFPVLGSAAELKAEEPEWWLLPDTSLVAVFRDNRRSGWLYRSFSTDGGQSWTTPVKTNMPDATSKMCGLRLSDGRYVLISNPNPQRRDPLTLSLSDDGLVFTKMLYLVGGRHVDYPHLIEREGYLYIAFAGGKQSVELLRIALQDVDRMRN